MKCNNEHSFCFTYTPVTDILQHSLHVFFFFFSETEGVYGCLLKSTRELSPGIISSHCSKEWKVIGEGKETKVLQWITLALPSNAGEGKCHFGGRRPGFKWLGEHSVLERVWVWFPEPTSGSAILPAFPATRDLKKSSCFCGYLHLYAHTYTHKHTPKIKYKIEN